MSRPLGVPVKSALALSAFQESLIHEHRAPQELVYVVRGGRRPAEEQEQASVPGESEQHSTALMRKIERNKKLELLFCDLLQVQFSRARVVLYIVLSVTSYSGVKISVLSELQHHFILLSVWDTHT